MKSVLSFILLIFLSIHTLLSQQVASWGDQNDGTYKNPILNADYPDSDIEELNGTYYMISSKQHMAPGMVILESKDLVNWRIINHVWDKLSWAPEYNWDKMNGYACGVWAGDLAYHDGTWYCYQIDHKHGLYVSTTKDIKGVWSKPKKILSVENVIDDPAVYWDQDTKQCYLICNTGSKLKKTKDKSLGNENTIFKMSWDGLTVLDEGKAIYTGIGAEAAKIFKKDNQWYIFIAEWYLHEPRIPGRIDIPENDRKQILLKSKNNSIYGPYEKRIVLEKGNGFERSCSQGSMIKAPNGSWWYMHQLIQNNKDPFQGRPQMLEPVEWKDGWPIIGIDIDNDGIGEPVKSFKKPIDGYPISAPQSDDDFNSAMLNRQWEWNHNPRDTHWSLEEHKGWLRLKASKPLTVVENSNTFWKSSNTLSQRIMGTSNGVAIAKFDISGMQPGQKAGFVRFGGVYHLLGVVMNNDNTSKLFFMNKDGEQITGPKLSDNTLYIKTTNIGSLAYYEYSSDNKIYKRFGPEFNLEFGRWTGDRLGFFSWNQKQEKGHIDIDWFKYNYDGPKSIIKK